MAGELAGKVALVTGASRGIGRAIALRLAEAGAAVAVHYGNSAAAAEATVAAIRAAGGTAHAVRADLAPSLGDANAGGDAQAGGLDAAIAGLFAAIDRLWPEGIDILVNNAGIGMMAALAETDAACFDRQFAINVRAPFFITRAAAARLRDGGRIVTISSMVALAAYPSCIAYAMTKASVNSFTRSLAAELGARGITVNAVAPGATATDFIADLAQNSEVMAALKAGAALGRIGEAGDIAEVVAFLASPAGGWITGQVVQASGGMHL
jgi:NAD(P)-dependent dehydrogenase (short-subunit alcohol dehydrogenase family)